MAREIKPPHFTQRQLWELMDYSPATGVFTWRSRPVTSKQIAHWNKRWAGQEIGALNGHGYLTTKIDGRDYALHRLAWFYMTGVWPQGDIDHDNTIRNDNSWPNLREATRSQNQCNRGPNKNNTSGHKGISWSRRHKGWYIQIAVAGVRYRYGYFKDKSKVIAEYQAVLAELHGPFARSAPNAIDYK